MLNKLLAIITFIISIIFFSYRKGKKDLKSEQYKDLVKGYEVKRRADAKFDNRVVTDDMRAKLRDRWSKK